MTKKKCKTCNGEMVVWELIPCPDCPDGKRVADIGHLTKKISDTDGIEAEKLSQADAKILWEWTKKYGKKIGITT